MIMIPESHPLASASDQIRIHQARKTDNFTLIGNDLLRNKALSFKARGILCHLLSHKAGWVIRMAELRKDAVDGEAAIRTGIEELIAAGYMTRERVKGEGGRMNGWSYEVYEEPLAPETRKSSIGTDTRFSTCGKSSPKNTKVKKTNVVGIVPNGTIPAASLAGSVDLADSGINEGDLALAGAGSDEDDASPQTPPPTPAPAPAADLALSVEGDDGKDFPWRQIMGALARIVPAVKMPVAGARRDVAMKQFWRKHGKTIGCFEALAARVAASDYLMARAGHTGQNGRPFTWGWIFSKNERGELRADAIMEGGYSTSAMAFVLEKQAAAAAPKTKRVVLVGTSTPVEVMIDEKLGDGSPRYRACDETKNGCPVYLDRK